jgi:hypothetical protein
MNTSLEAPLAEAPAAESPATEAIDASQLRIFYEPAKRLRLTVPDVRT